MRKLKCLALRWLLTNWRDSVANTLTGSSLLPQWVRLRILRLYGLRVGNCSVAPGCWFGGSDISIGGGTFINRACIFDNSASIQIGDGCSVGMRVAFITSDHEMAGPDRRAGQLRGIPIRVGGGAWIGTRATLLPGSTVGAGCVVGAGSVVLGECVPDSVYAGVPARLIRSLNAD